jgi:hypothetical protein
MHQRLLKFDLQDGSFLKIHLCEDKGKKETKEEEYLPQRHGGKERF